MKMITDIVFEVALPCEGECILKKKLKMQSENDPKKGRNCVAFSKGMAVVKSLIDAVVCSISYIVTVTILQALAQLPATPHGLLRHPRVKGWVQSSLQFSLPNPRFLSLLSRPLHRTDSSAQTASFVNAISVTPAADFSRLLDGQRMHPSAPSYKIKNLLDTSFLRTCSISVVSCEIDCRIRRSTL